MLTRLISFDSFSLIRRLSLEKCYEKRSLKKDLHLKEIQKKFTLGCYCRNVKGVPMLDSGSALGDDRRKRVKFRRCELNQLKMENIFDRF